MAELILTDEEKAAHTYLEWDDESLGKAVKKLALAVDDTNGEEALKCQAAALCLIALTHESNAFTSEYAVSNVTLNKGKDNVGDWLISVERMDESED